MVSLAKGTLAACDHIAALLMTASSPNCNRRRKKNPTDDGKCVVAAQVGTLEETGVVVHTCDRLRGEHTKLMAGNKNYQP